MIKPKAVALAAVLLTAAHASAAVSNFDTGAEGWTGNEADPNITYVNIDGNPGGYLTVQDNPEVEAPTFGLLAPGSFLGDQSDEIGGTFQFDAIALEPLPGNVPSFGTVTIQGPAGTLIADLAAGQPSGDWTTYSKSLTAAAWGVTEQQFEDVLSNITRIEVLLEYAAGIDAVGFDNVQLAIPEPASALLLLAPALTLAARRSRRD
jgi:hypothetical protein